MYISNNIYNTPIKNSYYLKMNKNNKSSNVLDQSKTNNYVETPIHYSDIPFGAIYNVNPKKLDINLGKNKLLKQISELLETNIQDADLDDAILDSLRKALCAFRAKLKRQEALLAKAEDLYNDKYLNPQQKLEKLNQLKKESRQLEKNKAKPESKPAKKQDEKLDYQLLNKFKIALVNEDFNLRKVIKLYYEGLNNVSSVEELSQKYPKIKIPNRPEQVVAEKIEAVLTRDFYEEVDELYNQEAASELQTLVIGKIVDLCENLPKKYNINKKFFDKIIDPTVEIICQKYASMHSSGSFSAVPEYRKIKVPQITETDMKMLSVDFDDFVLSVVRNHYLDLQKLNDIKYSKDGVQISLNELKDSDYKFEKMPEKIKKFITDAENLHLAQRDYPRFSVQELKSRLNYFANSSLSDNEEILKHIIDFDTCNFTDEDINLLIKFLKELDLMKDGEKALDDGILTIHTDGLRPKGTEKLNEQERMKAAEAIKLEQQKAFKLKSLKDNFDDAINKLYENNLTNIANTCSKYRPESLDSKDISNSEFIIKIINDSLSNDNIGEINKYKLEAKISRWDTFNYYKNNDATNPVFVRALEVSKNQNGEIDIDKAGQYIMNSEIVDTYPDSLAFVKESDIVSKIIERNNGNKELAIKYLMKLDTYQELAENEKKYITKFIDLFDQKDPTDKMILKYIIENNYVKTDTTVMANIHKTSDESIPVTIASKAKEEILAKYKYPTCIEYMYSFEDALSSFATDTGTSGIKKTGRNNKTIEYKMELKIKGHDDRLFSSKNDYCFDIFSDRGMH